MSEQEQRNNMQDQLPMDQAVDEVKENTDSAVEHGPVVDAQDESPKRIAQKANDVVYLWDHLNVYVSHSPIPSNSTLPQNGTLEPPFVLDHNNQANIWNGDQWVVVDVSPHIQEGVDRALLEIDTITDNIYNQQIGSRQSEYDYAYKQALEWAQSGYVGLAPDFIAMTAASTGITPEQAAKEIIDIAQKWLSVMAMIREKRLMIKSQIRAMQPYTRFEQVSASKEHVQVFDMFIKQLQEMLK